MNKRCPFCGSDQNRITEVSSWIGHLLVWHVQCQCCLARGPTATTDGEAWEKWNHRCTYVCDDRHGRPVFEGDTVQVTTGRLQDGQYEAVEGWLRWNDECLQFVVENAAGKRAELSTVWRMSIERIEKPQPCDPSQSTPF